MEELNYLLKIYTQMGSISLPIAKEWEELIILSFDKRDIYVLEMPNKSIRIDFSLVYIIEIGEKKYIDL